MGEQSGSTPGLGDSDFERALSRSPEEVLRIVAEETAAQTGDDFFRSLAERLSKALGMRYCFLAECLDDPATRVGTLAFWNGDGFLESFEYDLAGTPCEYVVAGEACLWTQDIQKFFPEDQDLVDLEAECYAAVPFQDGEGRIIGHLAVLHVEPIREGSLDLSILRIFAGRAGAELERQRVMAELLVREEDLRRHQVELEQRVHERTEELEAFTYTASHDLRSPLVTIIGFVSLLRAGKFSEALGVGGQGYLEQIGRAAQRMESLLEQLLAFSHLGQAEMELSPVFLEAAVEQAMEQLDGEVAPFRDRIEVGEVSEWVEGNQPILAQALSNLLQNAVKYAGVGSTPRVQVWCETMGQKIRLYVRDDGIGIAPEHQELIFKVFERSPEAEGYSGSGLGLSIVKRAVERMRGSVGVESERGAGSTFWIELERSTAGQSSVHSL